LAIWLIIKASAYLPFLNRNIDITAKITTINGHNNEISESINLANSVFSEFGASNKKTKVRRKMTDRQSAKTFDNIDRIVTTLSQLLFGFTVATETGTPTTERFPHFPQNFSPSAIGFWQLEQFVYF
jgi:hypothetical protein